MVHPIKLEKLFYTIPYGDTILEDINLEVGAGEFIGILGHNGTGKTTLLDLIMGFKKPVNGRISVIGEDPHSIDRVRKHKVIFLSQDVAIKGNLSIKDFLKFHSSFYDDYSVEVEGHLVNVFGLSYDMKIGALSTGQQKKVQVIAAFATKPEVIIIDEITAVLDPETRDIFFRELENVRVQYNSAILLATNIAEDLTTRAHKVFFIEDRKGVLHDPKDIHHLFNIGKAA